MLAAVFCSKDECCEVIGYHPPIKTVQVRIRVTDDDEKPVWLKIKFTIDVDLYPSDLKTSLTIETNWGSSAADAYSKAARLDDLLKAKAVSREGQVEHEGSVLLGLCQEAVSFCQEESCAEDNSSASETSSLLMTSSASLVTSSDVKSTAADLFFVSVTQFDHMRSAKNYIKTLERWTLRESSISYSRLIYGGGKGGNIFLLQVAESQEELKAFQQKLKTQTVDVDSNGRPCKEKMSKVLCGAGGGGCRLAEYASDMNYWRNTLANQSPSFEVIDFQSRGSLGQLKAIFTDIKLEKLFEEIFGRS